MITRITICDTCRRDKAHPPGAMRDGETLAGLIESATKAHPWLEVIRHSCLMGCDSACTIAIQGEGKLSYVLGGFVPSVDVAAGIVDYALAYHHSDTGQVPYRQWPEAVKGHFRARIPAFEKT